MVSWHLKDLHRHSVTTLITNPNLKNKEEKKIDIQVVSR